MAQYAIAGEFASAFITRALEFLREHEAEETQKRVHQSPAGRAGDRS